MVFQSEAMQVLNGGNGYWAGKYPMPEAESLTPEKYYLMSDRWGRRLQYHLYWNTNHSAIMLGISRWGKTFCMNQICKGEIDRGATLLYDNYKGESLPFKTRHIDVADVQLDLSLMNRDDWINLALIGVTKMPETSLFHLRRVVKEIEEDQSKLTLTELEKSIETSKGIPKNSKYAILNSIEELADENLISDEGFNVLKELKKNRVIEIDCSKNPQMRQVIIPHVTRIIVDAKQAGVIPRDQKTILAYDEIADPMHGIGGNKTPRTMGAAVKKAFTAGGVYNLLALCNTQLPQDTNSQIIGNCTHKFIFRMIEDNALRKLADATTIEYAHLRRVLPRFDKGECLFVSGKLQQIRRINAVEDINI